MTHADRFDDDYCPEDHPDWHEKREEAIMERDSHFYYYYCEDHDYCSTMNPCPQCNEPGKIAPMEKLTGWSSDYYKLPDGAEELQDLIEHKGMNFSVGNIFKAAYRLGEKRGTDELYDLDKILWFATREKTRILRQQEDAG